MGMWKLFRRGDEETPVLKGASEVEAAYLAWCAEMADETGAYYDPDRDGDNDAAQPDSYSLTRLGSVSQGTLWSVCDNSWYWGTVFVLDTGDVAEVFMAKAADGDELVLAEELSEVGIDLDALANDPAAVLLETLKATWTRAYIDSLPDSAFLYVEPGGTKDSSGKTKPRSLRHFPVYDKRGKLDLDHLRDALSRIPQSDLHDDAKERATARAEHLLSESKQKGTYTIVKHGVRKDGDAEQRYTLGVAYPASDGEWRDSHGDYATEEDVEKAAWGFMASGQVLKAGAGTDHADGTDLSGTPVESYIYRGPDWIAEDGETVAKAGDWMLGVVWSEDAWARIQRDDNPDGDLTGFSIQGMAVVDDD